MSSSYAHRPSSGSPAAAVPSSASLGFQFSSDIARDLAELEATGAPDTKAPAGGGGTPQTTTHRPARALPPLHTTSNHPDVRARAQQIVNPAAYAESFARPPTTSQPSSANAHTRRLSIDAERLTGGRESSNVTPGSASSSSATPYSSQRAFVGTPQNPSPRTIGAHFSAASLSGTPAQEHDNFYVDDAHYFNLGGSSFPLLPHNSLYESELHSTPGSVGGVGPERAFSPSGRVHAQHFTSILNMPVEPSFVRENATRAAAGASAYLPSLASVWTFATGIAPPETISRASDGFVAFAEESVLDPGEFILPPRPGLDERDMDLTPVREYVRRMKKAMVQYARNHPGSTLQAKFERAEQKRAQQERRSGRGSHRKLQRESLREEEEDDEETENAPQHDFPSTPFGAAPASSPASRVGSGGGGEVSTSEDAAASLQLQKDLNACYAAIPPVYFQEAYLLADQAFWRDDKDLAFLVNDSVTRGLRSMHGGGGGANGEDDNSGGARTPGGRETNPYDSFTALSSYHASSAFHLPSLEEKKALQLRAYKLGEERRKRVEERGEQILAIQSVLSGHLDLVEQNLQQQISLKSWIFFAALKNVQAIQQEITECLKGIGRIRGHVRELKETLSQAGLSVLQQLRTQENTRKLIRTLELTATVLKTSPTVQMLLSTGDYAASLQLIQSTRAVIQTELKGLECIRHVETKLNEHAHLIHQLMALEFCGLAIRGGGFYLSEQNTNVVTNGGETTLVSTLSPELIAAATGLSDKRLSSSPTPAVLSSSKKSHLLLLASRRTLTEDEEDRLVPLVSGLLELGEMRVVYAQYVEQLQGILKQRLMDLVYELLNEVTKEQHQAEGGKKQEGKEEKQNGKDCETSGSDAEEEAVDPEASAAAASLLSDAVIPPSASPTEEKSEVSVTPAATSAPSATPEVTSASMTDVPRSDASTPSIDDASAAPAAVSPAAATAPTPAPAPSPSPAANGTQPPKRQAAAIAMPVGAPGPTPPLPAAAAAVVPSPSAAATTTTATTASSPAAATSAPAIPAPSSSPAPGANGISARFSSLHHDQFLALLQPMFTSLMDLIQRASTIRHLIVTCAQANASGNISPQAAKDLSSQLNDMLGVLVEYVHGKVGKILQTRSGVHASLTLGQFRGFLDAVLKFIQEGESLSGKTFYNLRSTLLLQAKSFLIVFHQRCVRELGTALENEKWVRVDVPQEYQQLLDSHFAPRKVEIITAQAQTTPQNGTAATTVDPFADPQQNGHASSTTSASSQPKSLSASTSTWQNKSWNEAAEDGSENVAPPASSPALKPSDSFTRPSPVAAAAPASDMKRVLFVARTVSKTGAMTGGFMKFPVVHSLLVLLQIIGQYIDCSSQLQAVGSDILNRLVELLQMFNSRSCQLVLGAGAMHLSGLKSITATHLALASQSVGLLITQIPVLRSILSTRLPVKHHVLLSALERVKSDCEEHQREIWGKLSGIMGELIRGMVEKLEQLPWTKLESIGVQTTPTIPEESDRVDEPVKTLMKQTCSLHRALSDLLLVEQRDAIFTDISSLFLTTLREFLSEVDTKNSYVKLKVSYTVNHIAARLKTCTGVDEANIAKLVQLAA